MQQYKLVVAAWNNGQEVKRHLQHVLSPVTSCLCLKKKKHKIKILSMFYYFNANFTAFPGVVFSSHFYRYI